MLFNVCLKVFTGFPFLSKKKISISLIWSFSSLTFLTRVLCCHLMFGRFTAEYAAFKISMPGKPEIFDKLLKKKIEEFEFKLIYF